MNQCVREIKRVRSVVSLALLSVFLCVNFTAGAQNNVQVTGRVVDENNQPLNGVSVQIQKSKLGTATNSAGDFSISAPANATLLFSYVGYTDTSIAIGGRTNLDVRLSSGRTTLSDVVVIGYGTANKRDLTGSIVKIDGKVVADKPNANPVSSLQSKVAGLSVVNNGTPGQAPDIRIRGTVSIGQVHPLYVVDGILNDNIDFLNPNDIESIEVLKDPSSLAIFGVKGATGAIVITTKQARAGQTIVNFNSTYGFKQLTDRIKMVDANGFKTLFAEENANNGVATPDYSALTSNTDWISAVTRTGQYNNSNLTVQSGTDKNRVSFGLGYTLDQGIIKQEQLQRLNLSLNDELRVSKNIKLGANIVVSRQHYPYGATNILNEARQVIPQVSAGTKPFRVANPYGTDTITENLYSGLDVALQNSGVVNPLLELSNTWNKYIGMEYREVGSVYAEITFLKYLTFRSTFYGDISNVNTRQYVPLYYAYNPLTNQPYLYTSTTSVTENDNDYRKFQQDHILTFRKAFGEHNLTATAGFTTYYFGNFNRTATAKQSNSASGSPIPDDPRLWYITNGIADANTALASSSQSEYSTVSFLGRVLYNFKNKYFLNGSFRNDASSQIAPKNRNQQFWAAGAAWDVTKEEFMANQKVFDFIKVKGSVGQLGNQTTSDQYGNPLPYPAYPNIKTDANSTAVFGTNLNVAAQPAYTPSPNLKWETVNAWEAGVELNAFTNRLHFEGTYFNKTTNNLMTYVSRAALGLAG